MKRLAQGNDSPRQKMARFVGVGLINTLVGYGIYAALVALRVPYLIALLIATIAGVTFNYFSIGRLVFKSTGGLIIFFKFIAAYGVVYFANAIGLEVSINYLALDPYSGGALCLPPSVVLSWLLMHHWVFKKQPI